MKWNPEDYAKNSSAQLVWAKDLIAKLGLQGHETLLDVGCGEGKITAEFATAVPDGLVLGVDSSKEFIDYAQRHYPTSQYANLQFLTMDARKLEANHPFDVIFSNATLHWVDDHQAFLAGCSRLLAPQGKLIVSCGGAGNAAGILAVMDRLIQGPRWGRYFTTFVFPYFFYSDTQYARWLPEAGLSPERLELVEKDMTHRDPEGLAGWLRTTWMPYTDCIPAELREAFISDVVQDYLSVYLLDASGQSHVKMVRLEVEAQPGIA